MTFSLWFIFLINVDQLFPIVQVVDNYTQLSTGYLYASNRVPISGYHGHNGEQFAQWCTSWLHSPAATSSWSLGRRIRDWVSTPTYILFSKQVSKDNDPKPSSKLYCSSIVVNPHLLLSPNSRDQSAGWVSVCVSSESVDGNSDCFSPVIFQSSDRDLQQHTFNKIGHIK